MKEGEVNVNPKRNRFTRIKIGGGLAAVGVVMLTGTVIDHVHTSDVLNDQLNSKYPNAIPLYSQEASTIKDEIDRIHQKNNQEIDAAVLKGEPLPALDTEEQNTLAKDLALLKKSEDAYQLGVQLRNGISRENLDTVSVVGSLGLILTGSMLIMATGPVSKDRNVSGSIHPENLGEPLA